jgi:predicted nuclease of predicted toxin-antitoxin system
MPRILKYFRRLVVNAIVLTKDEDFVTMLHQFGSPPKVIWLTCGNTSNSRMRVILKSNLMTAILLPETNDLVEMNG